MNPIPVEELGPLNALLEDPEVSEIMVDNPGRICVERRGKLELVEARFANAEALLSAIRAIITPLGHRIDESTPIVDVRLPDRSLVTAVIPPISPAGPCLVIRKSRVQHWGADDLIRFGSWSPAIVTFLRGCVTGRVNILVSGGTSSGKTTIMNLLGGMIPAGERLIVVERVSEIALDMQLGVRLEGRPANLEGRGAITLADLIQQALKMRPERLIVGELIGAETWQLLQAFGSGHDGSLTLIHATSPRDALARLEVMATMAEPSVPLLSIRQKIATGLNLIVQIQRLPDGKRRITHISEITGIEREMVATRDIFRYEEGAPGQFTSTGYVPSFLPRLLQNGADLPMELFRPG